MLERFKETGIKLIQSIPIVIGGTICGIGLIITSPFWIPVECTVRFLKYIGELDD